VARWMLLRRDSLEDGRGSVRQHAYLGLGRLEDSSTRDVSAAPADLVARWMLLRTDSLEDGRALFANTRRVTELTKVGRFVDTRRVCSTGRYRPGFDGRRDAYVAQDRLVRGWGKRRGLPSELDVVVEDLLLIRTLEERMKRSNLQRGGGERGAKGRERERCEREVWRNRRALFTWQARLTDEWFISLASKPFEANVARVSVSEYRLL